MDIVKPPAYLVSGGHSNRREFLKKACQIGAVNSAALYSPAILAKSRKLEKRVNIYIPETGELVDATLWTPSDGYDPEALREISFALRDYRSDQFKLMHIKTLEFLAKLQSLLLIKQPTEIISGFRSEQEPSELLALISKNDTLHLEAKAMDIRMPGIETELLAATANSLRAGGVGLYNKDQFIHIDSGPVRTWS